MGYQQRVLCFGRCLAVDCDFSESGQFHEVR
jgi:hypothetical protein